MERLFCWHSYICTCHCNAKLPFLDGRVQQQQHAVTINLRFIYFEIFETYYNLEERKFKTCATNCRSSSNERDVTSTLRASFRSSREGRQPFRWRRTKGGVVKKKRITRLFPSELGTVSAEKKWWQFFQKPLDSNFFLLIKFKKASH